MWSFSLLYEFEHFTKNSSAKSVSNKNKKPLEITHFQQCKSSLLIAIFVCMKELGGQTYFLIIFFNFIMKSIKNFNFSLTTVYFYISINILFYYHIRHSNIKKYNREIEINISNAVQGDEMNISNQFRMRRLLFKKCNQFHTQTHFLIKFFYMLISTCDESR